MKRWFWIFCLLLGAAAVAREAGLQWASDGENVLITWTHHKGQEMRMYRSTQPFLKTDLDDASFPICKLPPILGASSYLDNRVAPGTTYYYAGQADDGWWFQADPVCLPARPLPDDLEDPWILIDKLNYCLEVHCHGATVKRYPVSFGANPQRRKLHQDHASTPEGRYQICGVQPKARWHKAYDVSYPNPADLARHKLLAPGQPIGGEVQIHGGGIDDNWTWGCIAMRNEDIDELFNHVEIGRNTVVWIVGSELTYQDLVCDEQSNSVNPLELGQWQRSRKLPVTCIQDRNTYRKLGSQR